MNYYTNLIHDAGSDNYMLFRSIDRLLHRHPEKHFPCSSSTDLANNFAVFFKDKIATLRSQLNTDKPSDVFNAFDTPSLNCSLDAFSSVTINELSEIAGRIASKSCCIDPLPAKLLVKQLDTVLPVICKMVNLSLETGFLPPSLKTAVILPLLKKPSLDHEVIANFRPISNLKMVSKIIEKVVALQLNHYLELNELHEPLQSAYKKSHSCETALTRVQNDVLRAIDDRHCVVRILLLLDLSSAFDTVDYHILLDRLYSKFGIRGTALKWLQSYLKDRSQFVSINGSWSQTHSLECGVPQGSVLGPILYLLYTSPLANILQLHNMLYHFYADDTQLYVSFPCNDDSDRDNTMAKIERCLFDIDRWMTLNKLKLNKDKTELLFLYSRHSPQKSFPALRFGSDTIYPSKQARNIGVIFDETMTMLPHVLTLSVKLLFTIYETFLALESSYLWTQLKLLCMPL